jgi:hypothetical protein
MPAVTLPWARSIATSCGSVAWALIAAGSAPRMPCNSGPIIRSSTARPMRRATKASTVSSSSLRRAGTKPSTASRARAPHDRSGEPITAPTLPTPGTSTPIGSGCRLPLSTTRLPTAVDAASGSSPSAFVTPATSGPASSIASGPHSRRHPSAVRSEATRPPTRSPASNTTTSRPGCACTSVYAADRPATPAPTTTTRPVVPVCVAVAIVAGASCKRRSHRYFPGCTVRVGAAPPSWPAQAMLPAHNTMRSECAMGSVRDGGECGTHGG